MARWQLTEAHYLPVEDCFWEQAETDRETGRRKIRKHPVPMFLDPKDPSCWTHKSGIDITLGGNAIADGAIVVCQGEKVDVKDLVFIGLPTPGMHPLDDEAREITAKAKTELKWKDGGDFYAEGKTYADTMMEKLADRSSYVSPEFEAMQKTLGETLALLAQVTVQNAELIKQLSPRRVV